MLTQKKATPHDKDICISKEDYEKVIRENEKLKTLLEQFKILFGYYVEI